MRPNFLAVCGNRARGNGHILEHKKFHTNARKSFFTVRVSELWNRLPTEVVDYPSLVVLKTHL